MNFNEIRKPFYLDPDTLIVKFPASKHMSCSHAEWFTDLGYPYLHTIRGYYWKHEDAEFIMIYNNNYSIPNLSTEFWVEFPFYNQEEALKCSQQS